MVRRVEGAVGVHYQIAHFPRGAAPAVAGRVPVSLLQNQWMSVGDCHRETDAGHDAEINDVVANVGHLLRAKVQIGNELFEYRQLRRVALMNVDNAQ